MLPERSCATAVTVPSNWLSDESAEAGMVKVAVEVPPFFVIEELAMAVLTTAALLLLASEARMPS